MGIPSKLPRDRDIDVVRRLGPTRSAPRPARFPERGAETQKTADRRAKRARARENAGAQCCFHRPAKEVRAAGGGGSARALETLLDAQPVIDMRASENRRAARRAGRARPLSAKQKMGAF